MPITLNDDQTFLICDDLGDVPEGAELGLYHLDSRFLSCYQLTLDGLRPVLLAARATGPATARHFLTNPLLPGAPRGQLTVERTRRVGQGLHEVIRVTNHGDAAANLVVALAFDADFAHVFEVKHAIESQAEALRRRGAFVREVAPDGRGVRYQYARNAATRTLAITFSTPGEVAPDGARFALHLDRHESWTLRISVVTLSDAEAPRPAPPVVEDDDANNGHGDELERMVRAAPAITTDSYVLERAYAQSVEDFAALRIRGEDVADAEYAIAAGIPWFMTLFGRDSLIAAYQALPFYPEAAKGVLRALARLQGHAVDAVRAEEPGKILHEQRKNLPMRSERVVQLFPYYGTIDATPLFLMLLAAVYRVTGDLEFVRGLREHALEAIAWMEWYGDRDGDGYLEYEREGETGLFNQGWKDSNDAVRFRDGTISAQSTALCEVQGYAYAARVGMAEIFEALREKKLATKMRREAAALKERFNRDFWLADRGFYAIALDGQKRPVDALTSNPGHLLWTGIADAEKARAVARRLVSPEMFSGWGIRTMGTGEGGYNPISYHCGSVWPHDTAIAVAGLARYGFVREAATVTAGLLRALANYPDFRLPELFAGYSTTEAPFPVEYPTANRPQAWASGSVFLLLQAMAGMDLGERTLRGTPFLPEGVERVSLDGVLMDRERVALEVERTRRGVRSFVPDRPHVWWLTRGRSGLRRPVLLRAVR